MKSQMNTSILTLCAGLQIVLVVPPDCAGGNVNVNVGMVGREAERVARGLA